MRGGAVLFHFIITIFNILFFISDIFFIRVKSRSMLVLFHEHKKVGFRKTKVFEKNTTRMGGDFFQNLQGLDLGFP